MKRPLALLLCLALIPLPMPGSHVRADDSDIFGANIQPNIMIFVDSSGSMADEIPGEPYNPATIYAGTFQSGAVYNKTGTNRYSFYAESVAQVTGDTAAETTAVRNALNTVGYWSGRIRRSNVNLNTGNYINYVNSPAGTLTPKMTIAKRVVANIINNVEGVRFGLSRFAGNGSMGPGGAAVVAPIGSSKSDLITALNGIPTSGYTPLGGALRDIGNYYKGLGDFNGNHRSSPIQYECQPNFVIFMSDGLQNGTVDVRTEATLRRTQDHSTTYVGTQNVIVHTVGFAVAESERAAANEVLRQAAINGGGTFYDTNNEGQLAHALEDAIRQITAAIFTFATPVIPTTSATGINRAYLAAVQSDPSRPFWRGYVKAYNRDANGLVKTYETGPKIGQPNEDNDCTVPNPDDPSTPLPCYAWEAGSLLAGMSAASRTIYTATAVNGTREVFSTSISETRFGLSAGDTATRDKIVNFVRGAVDYNDEDADGDTTEERPWKLGDVFHSTPVVVTPPFLPSQDATYVQFRQDYASRAPVVIVGSNGGMLHAFRESDGVELWGFIPPDLLARLRDLTPPTGDHPYFVDSSPIAADVKINSGDGRGLAWHTVVVFGERRGGRYYHALDVTNTENPRYLWSFTDPDGRSGESWSEPVIGKIKLSDGTEKYVAFFGGGYDTSSNNATGRAFFAVDLQTGQKLWDYYKTATTDDRKYMHYSMPASPLVLDLNGNGYVDRIYIGDVGGQVWRFDISEATTLVSGRATNWSGKLFFSHTTPTTTAPPAGEYYPAQAIYGTINAAWNDKGRTQLWIYFGTGDRNHPNATTSSPDTNRFYGVWDNTAITNGTHLTESSLFDVTDTGGAITQGWFFKLGNSEKVLASADIFNSVVFFTTFTPTGDVVCGSGGGDAKLYAVEMKTGFAALDWSNNAVRFTTTSAANPRATVVGTGIASTPRVTLTDQGTSLSVFTVVGTTSQQLPATPAPPPDFMRRILYWREVMP
jgi:type IV pilus assembly protein PilY1